MAESSAAPSADEANEKDIEALLQLVAEHVKEVRYIEAGKILRKLPKNTLSSDNLKYLQMADLAAKVMKDLHDSPEDSDYWKKQGESHGHRDTMIHYHVDDQTRLTCRIETPIESSLLAPLISVFNESDLFDTWMPKWRFPRVGIQESTCLGEWGPRGDQLISILVQLPTPIANREVVEHAFAVDAIDSDNSIVIKAKSQDPGSMDGLVTEPKKGVQRIDLEAGFLIRPCPPDHHLLAKSKANYPENEKLLLISLEQFVDPHLAGVPQTLQNFFTRTFMGKLWGNLLEVAEEVRANKRPKHAKAIAAKKDLYQWVEERVQIMFDNIVDEE
mmetsp:Transcript_11332/g.18750  ORF Transcript_11332/g.18750 Transcript_11332/m.18750 type:complete len:330 (+) Transcript_11332:97-1086(+)|eukprot:CAMPEP_0119008108 /NCGR_PEP_ID=MMETSP1176-20130426/3469_1 /TAXON_ID=265551 /ORGANISM="Synedropsis recta cf, Strain CCMP1620" /LENGTH=329 /DNA_ID=CAMNT_0006960379 /DNA_START=94 /DNA_END=1083 /DNA_ORIENTATION=-